MYDTGMLPNIVAHSLQVCRVALCLVDHIGEHRVTLDRELVQAAALLHDITKTRSLKTGESHTLTGAELIAGMGYPDVAYIIEHHVILDKKVASNNKLSEVEIVNYSDKRVLHDRVVSLQERLEYILERYVKQPVDKEYITSNWLRAKGLEIKVFGFLPGSPADMMSLLGSDNLSAVIEEYRNVCVRLYELKGQGVNFI
jgi:putative nucleotidyltransferase with HDIG domain